MDCYLPWFLTLLTGENLNKDTGFTNCRASEILFLIDFAFEELFDKLV